MYVIIPLWHALTGLKYIHSPFTCLILFDTCRNPDSNEGCTQIIANDRGHLKEGVPRSEQSSWGSFVGTWNMPCTIPGNITTYVARTNPAVHDIETQRTAHERYMENATSPKKDMLLLDADKVG